MTEMPSPTENTELRGILVRCVVEMEYAQARMGNDRSLTRAMIIREARKVLGWKSDQPRPRAA